MAVDNPQVVDAVSTDPKTGNILLDIADHFDWTNEDYHLQLLEDKINAYLAFIESGQLIESYPNAKGKQTEIHVACLYPPSERAREFYAQVVEILAEAGVEFSFRQSHFNSPPHAR